MEWLLMCAIIVILTAFDSWVTTGFCVDTESVVKMSRYHPRSVFGFSVVENRERGPVGKYVYGSMSTAVIPCHETQTQQFFERMEVCHNSGG
jgi:hypothetical protein